MKRYTWTKYPNLRIVIDEAADPEIRNDLKTNVVTVIAPTEGEALRGIEACLKRHWLEEREAAEC